jgi:hypothetical protein
VAGLAGSSQSDVQIREKRGHLRIIEPAAEGGHHSPAVQNDAADFGIRRGGSTGQGCVLEDTMQIWGRLFELEIVIAMAVCATHFIEMPTLGLLRRELWRAVATGQQHGVKRDRRGWKAPLKDHSVHFRCCVFGMLEP